MSSVRKRKIEEVFTNNPEVYKRKECPIVFTLMEAIKTITKQNNELERIIEANTNTKREIKETSSRIKRTVETMDRSTINQFLKNHKYEEIQKGMYKVNVQTDLQEYIPGATQTIVSGVTKNQEIGGADSK